MWLKNISCVIQKRTPTLTINPVYIDMENTDKNKTYRFSQSGPSKQNGP